MDLESQLIQYFTADQKFQLQNIIPGQSQSHNYYQRMLYLQKLDNIWHLLQKRGLVNHPLDTLKNSDLFKYSPYKQLSEDQYATATAILDALIDNINEPAHAFLVTGAAGSGKTILAVYLMKRISDALNRNIDIRDIEDDEDHFFALFLNLQKQETFDYAFVVPMTALRKTLKRVFKSIKGLKPSMIIGPNDVAKKHYDLLIVDEAHRLSQRQGITNYQSYDNTNKALGLPKNATQLDWIKKSSRFQILFYDANQSIRPADINQDDFTAFRNNADLFNLTSQLRVSGGNEYMQFIQNLFSLNQQPAIYHKSDYDIQIFDNANEMVEAIKVKDSEYGLCRNIAGFSWPWTTKNLTYQEAVQKGLYDIDIQGYHYIWNTESEWINSENAINEIGCIHRIQGYDLNYTGLIIGNELTYDDINKCFVLNKNAYYDTKGKNGTDDDSLLSYILNIYKVNLTRGIRGTYIYACDAKLRQYLKDHIK